MAESQYTNPSTGQQAVINAARQYLIAALGPEKGMKAFESSYSIEDPEERVRYCKLMVEQLEHIRTSRKGKSPIGSRLDMWCTPVDIKTFVEDPYFLNAKGSLYDEVLNCMAEMNNGEYEEAVLTGGIGVGKTTIAVYSCAYQLYLLSCYKNPQKTFGLDPKSEIVMIFQSLNAKLAKDLDYARFKALVEKCEYFKEHFPFNKDLTSEMHFPNRIIVKPVSGEETGAIGQNVIGGVIDEINFMAYVENSKQSAEGGTYDQAQALYGSIKSRRKSRFMQGGRLPGMLFLVSSKRFPGQFTDMKALEAQQEIEKTGRTTIYVYDKRLWEVKPSAFVNSDWFRIFIGDESRKARILEDDEYVGPEDEHLVDLIPSYYRSDFETRLLDSLREIAGISTMATHPFIPEIEFIEKAQRDDLIMFSREAVDFATTKVGIDPKMFKAPHLPRFVHIDLAVSGDSAGVTIGTVTGFKNIDRGGGVVETLPDIWIDGMLEVIPPKGGEILFYKIREVIYALKKLGMNIKWVTFDQFQSVDSMQVLKQAGYLVGRQSVDETTGPYDMVKNALYDGRLNMPRHKKVAHELATLEKDVKKNKIDHPANSSKDVSDSLAGVVFGLTTRREIWALHNVSLTKLPESVKKVLKGEKEEKAVEKKAA